MSFFSKYMTVLDDSLEIHNEGEFSGGDEAKQYSSFNSGGVEIEVGEFLYGLVRVLKPEKVLETGTHHGISASAIALGLWENRKGKLTTVEFAIENEQIARKRFQDLKIPMEYIELLGMDVKKLYGREWILDLIFLDTEPQTRFEEMIKFFPALRPGGFLIIHDLHRHMGQIDNEEHGFAFPYGELPEQIREWVKGGEAVPFWLPTPRGITIFYKHHEGDYVF